MQHLCKTNQGNRSSLITSCFCFLVCVCVMGWCGDGYIFTLEGMHRIAPCCLSWLSQFCYVLQVIIEGIGVFGKILGKAFAQSGFVHSAIYLLLRKLISSSSEIRITSDAVLQCLSVYSGYISVSLYFLFFFVFCVGVL